MKKTFITIAAAFFWTFRASAQVTLDTIVTPWNLIGYDFYPVQISSTETKYYFQDTLTNTFNLYNIDFTPFLLNVVVPEPFAPFTKNYEAIYISRTLFDCDSTNIEYAYNALAGSNRTFYIMRTDGTELFRLDSAIAPYCFGCLNGSQDIRPIASTSAGTKLFLYHPANTNNLHIYSLCGSLPTSMFDFSNSHHQSLVKIYPNPASGSLTFQIITPDNRQEYELVIVDNNAREVKKEKVNTGTHEYQIDVRMLINGAYFYSLRGKNEAYQTGKFVISK
jgi:hypothetical protein